MKNKTVEQQAEIFSEYNSIYDTGKDDTYFGFVNGFRAKQKEEDKAQAYEECR